MDQVDAALQNSWISMLERIERDPAELARRRQRAQRICQRPVRPWCIAIRASDTRIDEWGLSWSVNDDAQGGRPHTVEITQWDLRDLTAPIRLGPWPGVPVSEAAKLLGRRRCTVHYWAKAGALRVEHYDRRIFDHCVGGDMIVVWSPSPIDPNAEMARPPHPMWGTLWQHLASEVPTQWRCTLQRVPGPVTLATGGTPWRWVCPGRRHRADEENGPGGPIIHTPCGRLVRNLYLPLPCWSIPKFRGEMTQLGIPTPPWADLLGQPMACAACWRIVPSRLTGNEGWNLFVSHITGGMLTGREVPRPADEAPLQARRSEYTGRWRPHTAARRERVRAMLLAGDTHARIAKTLGVKQHVVATDACQIYRAAGIPPRQGSRWALARKFHWGGVAEAEVTRRLQALGLTPPQEDVARLIVRGWTARQIACELGIKAHSVEQRASRAYRKLGIHGRAELRALVGIEVPAAPPAAQAPDPARAAG